MKIKKKVYYASFNYIELALPYQAVVDCHHQGQCDEDAQYWVNKLELDFPRELLLKELSEYGIDGLETMDDELLHMYLVWLGAANIQESTEWSIEND